MLKRSHFDQKGQRIQTYNLLPNMESEYAMEKRFGIEAWQIQQEIREFNSAMVNFIPTTKNDMDYWNFGAHGGNGS